MNVNITIVKNESRPNQLTWNQIQLEDGLYETVEPTFQSFMLVLKANKNTTVLYLDKNGRFEPASNQCWNAYKFIKSDLPVSVKIG